MAGILGQDAAFADGIMTALTQPKEMKEVRKN
jgi:hypothetical protein